ncbi:GNAT family N-acetyltransferase [Pseudonocardia sp. GCM10023141]|uniref:GNAT family N-acetyltransferase n=1 Tax=Pseudonocardia sp. GCM10023141 TaxID=3252653 RepID=UPI0036225C41
MTESVVRDNPDESRFEIEVDETPAGFAEYVATPGRITFTHTEIDPGFSGKGLAGVLIRTALDAARDQGLSVLPLCPFVRSFIAKHPEYVELVPAGSRARFELA